MPRRILILLLLALPLVGLAVLFRLRANQIYSRADALLHRALTQPGDYTQVCDAHFILEDSELFVWGDITYGQARLSQENIAKLQANRGTVIPALVRCIEQIDLTRPPVGVVPENKHSDETLESDVAGLGVDPKSFSNVLLQIIFHLKAVEAIPALLRLEAELHHARLQLEKDPSFPLPQIDGYDDGAESRDRTPEEQAETRDWDSIPEAEKQKGYRLDQIHQVQMAHLDALSLIGDLLREERNPALLATSIEKQYQQAIRDHAKKFKEIGVYKTPRAIPYSKRDLIIFDPIIHVPRRSSFITYIPYTEALRDEIIQAARTHQPN